MKNKILFPGFVSTAICFLLSATAVPAVQINWGAGTNPILDSSLNPLPDTSHTQLIWDRDQDGIDPPALSGLPSGGDTLISESFIGHGSFIPGTFSENTLTGMVTVGDAIYVRAWEGRTPSQATHYGDTRDHNPSLWTIDSDLDFTLDATFNSSWATLYEWVGVEESEKFTMQNEKFELHQNTPNPFRSSTLIRYTIPAVSSQQSVDSGMLTAVRLSIYDITGRLVEILVDEYQKPGVYQSPITNHQLPGSGVYFYRLQISQTPLKQVQGGKGDFIATQKLTLLK